MATTPTPPPKQSALQRLGHFFANLFKFALPIAEAVEPVIAIAAPWAAPLYQLTLTAVAQAEGAAVAAGAQNGTGPQKLALVLSAIEPIAVQYLTSQGIKSPTTAQISAYINSVVAGLNAFEAAEGVPAVAPSTTSTETVTVTP